MEQSNLKSRMRTKTDEEPVLSLREFRDQYMSRVLSLVDMDLNQAATTLRVSEHDIEFLLERA